MAPNLVAPNSGHVRVYFYAKKNTTKFCKGSYNPSKWLYTWVYTWNYSTIYRGYFTPFISGLWAHLVLRTHQLGVSVGVKSSSESNGPSKNSNCQLSEFGSTKTWRSLISRSKRNTNRLDIHEYKSETCTVQKTNIMKTKMYTLYIYFSPIRFIRLAYLPRVTTIKTLRSWVASHQCLVKGTRPERIWRVYRWKESHISKNGYESGMNVYIYKSHSPIWVKCQKYSLSPTQITDIFGDSLPYKVGPYEL